MAAADLQRAEISDVLYNPFTGWVPWANGGPYPQPHRLVYAEILWRNLEPVKYNFDWNGVETNQKFSYWAGRGVKIIIRFVMDDPGIGTKLDIPDWLYSEIGGQGTAYSGGFSPNYSNPALISNHKRVIAALGQKYDSDPRIAFVEIGSIGHWGEFHTTYLVNTDQGYMPPINISDQYVQHYIGSFKHKMLLGRRPFQIFLDNNIGLYNDMFGNQSETERFIRYFQQGYTNPGNYGFAAGTYPAMPDFWKTSPSGGEFGDYPGTQYLADTLIQRTLQYATDSHTSWLGPSCPADQPIGSPLQTNMNSLLKVMGYRFVLQSETYTPSITAGGTLNVTMQWANKGVAPFYYKWPLELSLSDSNGNVAVKVNTSEDIRTWLPGTKTVTYALSIPASLAAGKYTLCVAIIDPDTNSPGIDLAMTGRRTDGRYTIGNVSVTGSVSSTPPVIPPAITIDGNASDWSNINAITTTTIVYSLKLTNDTTRLYICVQGQGLNVMSQFYINTDGNSATGYIVSGWSSSGCEYLLENNTLYKYTGNGSTWSWSRVGTVPFAQNYRVIEADVPLSSMNLVRPGSVRIGFVRNNAPILWLPASGQPLALYTLK